MVHILVVGICIYIVAVPEGLALAVSIAMALSIDNLSKDKIQIKNLHVIQKIGMIHDILVGITGTITVGKLSVASWHLFDEQDCRDNAHENYFNRELEIPLEAKDRIKDCILANTNAWLNETDPPHSAPKYEIEGQEVERAML